MNNYPYYIVVFFDGGLLKKVFRDKKFKAYNSAFKAMNSMNPKYFKNFLKNNQVMILEYSAEYQGKIITISNFGELVSVNEPIKINETNS